jgi:hypothetical protein
MSQAPKIVFIVPYRNRPQHKFFFSTYLTSILSLSTVHNSYEIYFSHQCDKRSFNRGSTKNIGFLAIKEKYPNDYKNITFVFNDIDTIPFSNIFNYQTTPGIVKHFYGFDYALGGIVSITGTDFEAVNGYPGFWGWGLEDTVLQKRCENANLHINRDQFYPIGSPDILHLFDGVSRLINRKDPFRASNDNGYDGLQTIANMHFTIDIESKNPLDNIHVSNSDKIFFINIDSFTTATRYENNNFYKYDLRNDSKMIFNETNANTNTNTNANANAVIENNDWTNIPFVPSSEKKAELIKQYGHQGAEQIINYSYENSVDPTVAVIPPHLQIQRGQKQGPLHNQNQNQRLEMAQIQQYNQLMQQFNSKTRIIPPNINKFSPAYSRIISAKPRATTSANIKLGGVYNKR